MKWRLVLSISLILLITFSGSPAEPQGAGGPSDWTSTNANSNGTNFVQQDQLTSANANQLALEWAYPFPAASPPKGLNLTGQGAIAPPLIVGGTVYEIMNDLHMIALRATDGELLWTYQPTLNRTGLPLGLLPGHVHGLTYNAGDIWASMPDCSALALNALTGAVVMRITKICSGIPGNAGKYDYSGAPIVFDGNTLFWTASSVSEGTDAGRGFVAAYDVTNGRLLWRWYVSPPPQEEIRAGIPRLVPLPVMEMSLRWPVTGVTSVSSTE